MNTLTPAELNAALVRIAKSHLASARVVRSMLIGETKEGTVELSAAKIGARWQYCIVKQGIVAGVLGNRDARLIAEGTERQVVDALAALYVVEVAS